MSTKTKAILISGITSRLKEENEKRNKKLREDNLFSEQNEFDTLGMIFKLSGMSDKDFNRIVNLVL